jgi:hypothetical protein
MQETENAALGERLRRIVNQLLEHLPFFENEIVGMCAGKQELEQGGNRILLAHQRRRRGVGSLKPSAREFGLHVEIDHAATAMTGCLCVASIARVAEISRT